MTSSEAIDAYYADCVRCALASQDLPEFPSELAAQTQTLKQRLDFHGIALLIAEKAQSFANWPRDLVENLQEQARLQAIWEADHRGAIGKLIEQLHEASFTALAMKGTALAYSIYPNPALRRRGDTDLLIECDDRERVREVFRQSGFEMAGDKRTLQETWNRKTPSGFTHQVDLHWAISSSFAISDAIERDHPRKRQAELPNLSPAAACTGPIDAFIQICINRSGHRAFGYHAGSSKLLEGDRLIWAVDLHLLASGFSDQDWSDLASIADSWGASRSVASGAAFARRALAVSKPHEVEAQLMRPQSRNDISDYYETGSAWHRFNLDFSSARGAKAKSALAWRQAFPSSDFMQERYPHGGRWPLAALHLRRLLDGAARMLLGRSQ